MRRLAIAALVLFVLLSACVTPFSGGSDDQQPTATLDGQEPTDGEGGDDSQETTTTPGPAPADDGAGDPPDEEQPDPDGDVLGWEAGYWYNDPLAVDNSDGLNATERERVIGRAMARVELVRGLEFQETVNVSVVSREEFSAGEFGDDPSEALRTFDNAKFEAMLLVGNDEDSIGTQDRALNASVGGYYSTESEAIVIVSDSPTPTFDSERTLAHELVHALQDQHFEDFNDTDQRPRTRDAYNGRNGLVEGDANAVQHDYMGRCDDRWRCVSDPSGDDGPTTGDDFHMGVYLLEFFPYADGPSLIAHLRDDGGWDGVGDAYERVPTSATEVIYPDRYGTFEPRNVTLSDDLRGDWERVRPPERLDYGRLGQSALSTMFAYTIYDDYNRTSLVSPRAFVNSEFGQLDQTDPLNYDLEQTRGWTGDRFHAYERDGETAYVWRLAWESPGDAERFAENYRDLLSYWDGERVDDDTWRVPEKSPFTGAIYVEVDGDAVTIAKAPTASGLGEVYAGAR